MALEIPSAPRWPREARAACAFTFDLDAETAWISRDAANIDRLSVMSQGAYGPKVGVPLIALAEWKVQAWPADKLPPHLRNMPAVKPGSRGLA